ncbi:MAG: SBBP repeat-containing protein [Candidatus Odinarchaeota archaeon]
MKKIYPVVRKKTLILLMVLLLACIPGIHSGMNGEKKTAGLTAAEGYQDEIQGEVRRNVEKTLGGFNSGFVENKGQKNEEICFYTENTWLSLGFAASEVKFIHHGSGMNTPEIPVAGEKEQETGTTDTTFSLNFPGSKVVEPAGEGATGACSNYFLGTEKYVNNQYYGKVIYRGLYDNIDLVYGLKDGQIKYEFFVYPGGRVEDIQLQWNGPVTLKLQNGDMQITVQSRTVDREDYSSGFSFTDTAPVSYQSLARNEPVEGSFKLLGEQTYGFNVPDYDQNELLIIDPLLLTYSTYVSGGDDDVGYDIAVDATGHVYVTGWAYSTDFPTLNAYSQTSGGSREVFVFKLSPGGNNLIYSTYIGGTNQDCSSGIAVASNGHAYVTGWTYSTDFPTSANAYDQTGDGSTGVCDVFFCVLSAGGNLLLYSTYVSGTSYDAARRIAVDSAGDAYITGETVSTNFPNTTNAFQDDKGDVDGFVLKLSPDANGSDDLLYSTYIGGSSFDSCTDVAIDSSGNAYVSGYTNSADFPTTVNAYQENKRGGYDGFVLKLSPGGNGVNDLLYSTYIGGSNDDQGRSIAVDSDGNAYVTGGTKSIDFDVLNAYNSTGDGSTATNDAFVCKLPPGGNTLLYSTYIAGSSGDYGTGIAVDAAGCVYIIGETTSADFPSVNAFQEDLAGSTDVYVSKLSPGGNSLIYSTYIGGSGGDYTGVQSGDAFLAGSIAVDSEENVYITGNTYSDDFPAVNAYDAVGDADIGIRDAFVSKLSYYTPPAQPRDLSAAVTADQQILLVWSPPADDGNLPVSSYRVNRSTTSGSGYSFLARVTGTVYLDPTAVPGTTYYYRVTAVNVVGESLASNEVMVTIPAEPVPVNIPTAPVNLTCTAGENIVYLNWSVPVDDGGSPVLGYRLYRGTSSGSYLFMKVTTSTVFNDTTATGGITYYYIVTAVNAAGESLFSNEASATPTAPVPTTTSTTSTTTTTTPTTTTGTSAPSPGWTLFIFVPSLAVLFFRRRTFRKASKLQRNNDGGLK